MTTEITHFHLFCGAGGGALGFNQGAARVGSMTARFRCLGGVDSDARAIRDFDRLAGVPGTVLDLFDREQYTAFHGSPPPPAGWREATPQDLHRAAQNRRPDIVFLSAPCKGFSGLLSGASAASAKYQALNQLALRGLMLALAAWGDDPPPLFLFENVPRIAQRGRHLLDQIRGLLEGHGYAVAETAHDCGELGGLAQHRRRFLLVARHRAKVPAFLYEPPKRRVRAIGEVLGVLAMPEDPSAGPMHRLSRLKWDTWMRLALIPAGGDWRDLPKGKDSPMWRENQQYGVVPWTEPAHTVTGQSAPGGGAYSVADPRWGGGGLGVSGWDEPSGTVTGEAYPSTGRFSVADPRWRSDTMGVRRWDEPSGTVTGRAQCTTGAFSVADPRAAGARFNNVFRVVRWDEPAPCINGGGGPSSGAAAVADPRIKDARHANIMRVVPWEDASTTVTGATRPAGGAQSVADPRPWAGAGHYGVLPWDQPAGAVTASGGADNGRGNVADPRGTTWIPPEDVPLIIALDGTWHRPLTTYELAALQGFPVGPGFELDGVSHTSWRERIGNAVPPPAAQAIAGVMGQVLLLAATGTTFVLSGTPIWVRDVAIALGVEQ